MFWEDYDLHLEGMAPLFTVGCGRLDSKWCSSWKVDSYRKQWTIDDETVLLDILDTVNPPFGSETSTLVTWMSADRGFYWPALLWQP